MESDLVHFMNKGAGVEELTAGLAYSIVHNYLQKVVAGKRVGSRIFFQGGVAANKAVVSAFEQVTGKAITVPPHHEVTGAIGAAIIAMREQNNRPSTFKGFDLSKRAYTIKTFECAECANRCTVRKVSFEGEQPLFYGSRCEKYDVRKKSSDRLALPDLFAERERMLLDTPIPEKGRKTIGIPRMLYVSDYLPFWRTFFSELGYRVVLSDRTSRTLVNKGLEATSAETCFPAKVALGHLQDLLDKGVDLLFLPSYIRFPVAYQKLTGTQACPYVQAFPYLARASLNFGNTRTIEPVLQLQDRRHFGADDEHLDLGAHPVEIRDVLRLQRLQAAVDLILELIVGQEELVGRRGDGKAGGYGQFGQPGGDLPQVRHLAAHPIGQVPVNLLQGQYQFLDGRDLTARQGGVDFFFDGGKDAFQGLIPVA